MPREYGPFTVLVVCDGNVCRSPAAQFAIASAAPGILVESAAAHGRPGARLCEVVAATIGPDTEFAERFRSRRLDTLDIADYELVLTVTSELRSEITRAFPEQHSRLFTLREAAGLLALGSASSPLPADGVARHLDAQRGAASFSGDARLPRALAAVDPLDIPDAHRARARRHRDTVKLALDAGARVGHGLGELLGPGALGGRG